MERDSLVARLGKLHEYDLVLDTNAYPKGPMAEGRDVYRVIGWEGADRGGLLLSEVEAREVRAAFRESSAAAALSRPTIGIQAVKALADRVRALLLVDQPASWEERRKIADELESLSALHPAPEAASPEAEKVVELRKPVAIWTKEDADLYRSYPTSVQDAWDAYACEEATIFDRDHGTIDRHVNVMYHWTPPLTFRRWVEREKIPTPSDTAPSPKGVSDGVRAAAQRAVDAFRTYAIALRGPFATRYDTANDLDTQAKLLEAALSQEPVAATAEERAASKEGA